MFSVAAADSSDALNSLGQRGDGRIVGPIYGTSVPMITELVNDSNVQFLDQVLFISYIENICRHNSTLRVLT